MVQPVGGSVRTVGLRVPEDAAGDLRAFAAPVRGGRLGLDAIADPAARTHGDERARQPADRRQADAADDREPRRQPVERSPSALVQLRLLQAFQNTGRIGAAGLPGQGLAIDYQVVTELRRFEIAFQPGARRRSSRSR